MVPGIRLELGGTVFIVPPLSLGAIELLHERLGQYSGTLADAPVVIDALTLAIKRNYPTFTRQDVADLVGLENFEEVMLAVMDVSGLKRKALEAESIDLGKAPAASFG